MAKRRIIPLFIPHAGCPCACVFCNQKKITGMDTPVTPEEIAETIRDSLPWAGMGCELAFYGGSFTALPVSTQNALLEAAQPFRARGEVADIRVSTRPDAIDQETVQRLRDHGVTTVELGCQSMDDAVLRQSERGHTAEDIRHASRLLTLEGMPQVLQMMTGLPGDDGSASLETARQLAALHPQGVRIYPTVVLRGTELEKMMCGGTYTPQSVEEAVDLCASLYEIFLKADIPVIRLGLNPTEELSGGEAVAGAYDPALGERVLSRMYLRRARALLEERRPGQTAVFSVDPRRVSVMVGQRRENILALEREFGLRDIKVRPDGASLWEISLKIR